MKVIRPGEKAFEAAWKARVDVQTITEVAYRAARHGRHDEIDACVAMLRRLDDGGTDELAEKLHAIARCVRAHPSFRKKAS